MKKISVLSFVFLIIISATAFAARWEWVTSDDDSSLYIDVSNIRTEYDQWNRQVVIMSVWSKFEYLNPTEEGTKTSLNFLKFKINGNYKITSNVLWGLKSYVNYDSDGHVISSNSSSYDEWNPLIPDSIAEGVYKKACSYAMRPKYK